jgi:PAS domain S-box-containing protein
MSQRASNGRNGTTGKLRVLFVEDQMADVELCLRELRRAGLEVDADVARNRGEFLEFLRQGGHDLVLCDYNLPEWTGLDALEALRRHGNEDIPFILVSGSVGEEAAVELVRKGASDFIIKDRLVRLPLAIRRALEEKALREERRRAEETLRLQTKALETAANAIVITDREGHITWVNPAFTRLTGYRADEVLGRTPRLFKSGKHDATFYHAMWGTVLAGEVWQGELINRRRDGTLYTEEQTITPMFNDRGEISHFISVKQDITERKRAEEDCLRALKLEAENRALMRADQMKTEFLADMSHEFRTPLNSILGFSELLLETCQNLTAAQQEDLRLVRKSAENLLALVNDSLDLARIEAGHVKLDCTEVPLRDTFARILDVFHPRLRERALKAAAEVEPPGLAAFADSRRLEQILGNLVGNALKFTGRGGITLRARADHGGVVVSVEDTGVGIPADDLPHIFNKFYQARQHADGVARGTGLGLAITRQLVELHGGRIWAQSAPGKGTTISFLLPDGAAERRVGVRERADVARAQRTGD